MATHPDDGIGSIKTEYELNERDIPENEPIRKRSIEQKVSFHNILVCKCQRATPFCGRCAYVKTFAAIQERSKYFW